MGGQIDRQTDFQNLAHVTVGVGKFTLAAQRNRLETLARMTWIFISKLGQASKLETQAEFL